MKRGEIWVARLDPARGAEVGKARPVLIVEADFLVQQGEPTIVVLPLTSQVRASKEPLHVTIPARDGLKKDSQVMPEHPRSIDRRWLVQGPLTQLELREMAAVERSLLAVLGMYR